MDELLKLIEEMNQRSEICEGLLREFEKESKIFGQYIYTSKKRKDLDFDF